ncbi:hypothetical protein AC579_6867 [Pseudocercospora musae]|uniref:Uncharacterized protein n=1 Tax=Pseudocercospora musae TaxID=113226 RepID=A0A139I972_9PEZI|nr:hypothetical protein AC579_6867 [Pseudocercospora musae]
MASRRLTQKAGILYLCVRRPRSTVFFLLPRADILIFLHFRFFGAFAVVFQNNHGFNECIFVGMLAGVSCDPLWRKNYIRLVENNSGVSEPEFRLAPTILGALIVPVSLFVPIVFSIFFGLGNILRQLSSLRRICSGGQLVRKVKFCGRGHSRFALAR